MRLRFSPVATLLPILMGGAGFVACGDSERTEAADAGKLPFRSGLRLRAMVWDGGDGARRFEGFVDTELGERCSFMDLGDGVDRCVPDRTGEVVFVDGECTQAVIPSTDSCGEELRYGATASWGRRDDNLGFDDCGVPRNGFPDSRVFRSTGVASDATPSYHIDYETGECIATGAVVPPGWTIAEAAPPFVAAKSVTARVSPRLARSILVAEDGAMEVRGTFDLQRGEPCSAPSRTKESDDPRCKPARYARMTSATHYAEAGCTVPAVLAADCAEPPTVAVHTEWVQCSEVSNYYALGEPLTEVYIDGFEGCQLWGGLGDSGLNQPFAVGPTVDPATFPAVERVSVGTGALRVESSGTGGTWLSGGGAFVDIERGTLLSPGGAFVDTERGVWCEPYETDAGVRCLSFVADARPESLYADDSCTTRIFQVDESSCYGGQHLKAADELTTVTFGIRGGSGNGCKPQSVVAAYELGENIDPPNVFVVDVGGACVQHPNAGTAVYWAWRVLHEIPLDTLPSMTLRQE